MARMTIVTLDAAKAGIIAVGRRLDARGWAPATAGNYSARLADGFAVTASGWHKGRLREEGILKLDEAGKVVGDGKPSAETQLHLAIYRQFPETGGAARPFAAGGRADTCVPRPRGMALRRARDDQGLSRTRHA